MPRPLAWIVRPLIDAVLPAISVDDPWERLPTAVPTTAFGPGSTRPFRWYFEGESQVRVASVDDVCEWLLGCKYVDDRELFNEPDFWQHPCTFERLRQGDCEDHALWAWRKLVELGIDAELVSGRWDVAPDHGGGHVWVVFRDGTGEYVLEGVCRTRAEMVKPLDDVRAEYTPHVAVNARFETNAFSGSILLMQEQREARRARRGSRQTTDAGTSASNGARPPCEPRSPEDSRA